MMVVSTYSCQTLGRNDFQLSKFRDVWKDCMWVGVPLLAPAQTFLSTPVKIRLRVTRPYRQYTSDSSATFAAYRPYYRFSTYDLVSEVNQTDVAKNALSLDQHSSESVLCLFQL